MDTPNVPVDCASGARLREQVATLAHQSAGLREDAARARESERVTTASCVSALGQTRRLWLRRERLARWAGVVAADTERRHTRVATTCFHLATGALRDVLEAHTPLRAAYNDAVRDLARSWRSA